MAEEEEPPVREWEVVSLTASTYAAAPGPVENQTSDDETNNSLGLDVAETSNPLFMSRQFVLLDCQEENLLVQPESKEIQSVHESEYPVESEDFGCQSIPDEGFRSEMKDQNEINVEGLNMSDNILGALFDENGDIFSAGAAEFKEGDQLPGLSVDEKQSIYSCAELGTLCSESILSEIAASEERSVIAEVAELTNLGLDSRISDLPTSKDYDAGNLPCGAWWKRKAVSLYANAKDTNAFWSIFVAAAVMGLVILGQRWQQEKWKLMQLKWQLNINDEMMSRMFSPLTRFKDVLVGGHRPSSFVNGRSSLDH